MQLELIICSHITLMEIAKIIIEAVGAPIELQMLTYDDIAPPDDWSQPGLGSGCVRLCPVCFLGLERHASVVVFSLLDEWKMMARLVKPVALSVKIMLLRVALSGRKRLSVPL